MALHFLAELRWGGAFAKGPSKEVTFILAPTLWLRLVLVIRVPTGGTECGVGGVAVEVIADKAAAETNPPEWDKQ